VIEPHASGIIARVNVILSETFTPLPPDRQGTITTLRAKIDEAYMARLETLIIDPKIIREARSLRLVYTPIQHRRRDHQADAPARGIHLRVVPEQDPSMALSRR
jgi:hypothetical protein